jgi:NitT/TauT family transport system permease protein
MTPTASRMWQNGAALLVGLAVCWQLLYWGIGEVALRSPLETARFTAGLLAGEMFWPHLLETMRAFALALLLSVAIGLPVGALLGLNRFASAVFEPILVSSYAIPKITLYPIILLMFGLGISAKVAFGVIHGVIPIALFTIGAVRHIRPVLLKTGRVMGLGPLQTATHLLLPAAMPEIFAGLRIGFSLTLIGTLLGEMFASQRGLGFLLMNAIGLHNIDLIMALTFLLSLFAGVASFVLLFVDRRLRP